ncbi:type IV secretory system conjugative DNA transfer family protein [Primorskyibacter marinus]|uniref:type IV secretory system conjugative DNA transfer family protein n=1 Tax=Primorskyibacter marinus TaxID=1977320 RepID=UPI000E30324C|nr:type IV secretory system conjugative DNA transfer family protein [Primorskyibacter marinus]
MKRLFMGYILFSLVGLSLAYLMVGVYLAWVFDQDVDHLFFVQHFWWLRANFPAAADMSFVILGGGVIAGLGLALAVVSESLSTFGVTHWQSKAELRKNKMMETPGSGFLLAKTAGKTSNAPFICSKQYPHCMIVAPTGRGKGRGFVIPNLLTFKGSTVTLDVKGENFEKTARCRVAMGDKVFRFAPTSFKVRSHRYNPLLRIYQMPNEDQRMFELDKMANLFLQTENPANQSLLRGGITAFIAAGMLAFQRGTPTMGEIYRIVNGGGNEFGPQYALYAIEAKHKAVKLIWTSLSKMNEKTLSSFISLLNNSGLDPWKNAHFDRMTNTSDFDFDALRKEPHSIYLTIRSQDIEPLAGLIRLFFSDLIATLEHHEPDPETEPWPVMIIMDEFHKLGKMPIVADGITTLRSYGGRLAIITQTIPKLDEIYGRNERLSLEGGAGIKSYMTPSEELTIENLSDACGMTTKRRVQKSRQVGFFQRTTMTERTEEVPLLTQDEARRMDKDDVVLVIDGDMPVKSKAIVYYDDPYLNKLYKDQSGPYPERDATADRLDDLEAGRPAYRVETADEAPGADQQRENLDKYLQLLKEAAAAAEKQVEDLRDVIQAGEKVAPQPVSQTRAALKPKVQPGQFQFALPNLENHETEAGDDVDQETQPGGGVDQEAEPDDDAVQETQPDDDLQGKSL